MFRIGVVVLFVVLFASPVFAVTPEGGQVAMADAKATAPVEVGNSLCPVSGEKVGGMGDVVKYEYNGKVYNLCCAMCAKDFKKDPEKYSKIAEDEVAAASEGSGS